MDKIYLSVVIPSFDEMANLQKGVLDKVVHFLNKKNYTYEVIIVDDGSKDGSVEFVESLIKENPRFRLIKHPHLGKAGAVTTGVLKTQGEYVLFTDMDQATPIEEIDKLLPVFDPPEE
ncbi:MAG: glycosyltransferase [Candidatus Levybacteria bacterium]|nr:glycosyltransferase [Candidatus Levybacteria bacterium]